MGRKATTKMMFIIESNSNKNGKENKITKLQKKKRKKT